MQQAHIAGPICHRQCGGPHAILRLGLWPGWGAAHHGQLHPIMSGNLIAGCKIHEIVPHSESCVEW